MVDIVETFQGPRFRFEMAGYVYKPGEHDVNEWGIAGEPDLTLSNGVVPRSTTTCTQFVNRIPDVINAAPGFVTVDQLPPLRYPSMPLHANVTEGQFR